MPSIFGFAVFFWLFAAAIFADEAASPASTESAPARTKPKTPISIDIINDLYFGRPDAFDYRLLVPAFDGQLQISWDLKGWEPTSIGYRWPFQKIGDTGARIQPRVVLGLDKDLEDLDVPWVGLNALTVHKKWDLFSAARIPTNDTRTGFFNEFAYNFYEKNDWYLRGNVIETHAAGRPAGWSGGTELMYWKHPVQLRFAWFDSLNDRGRNEWRFWFVIPVE